MVKINKRFIYVILIVLILIFIGGAIYFTWFNYPECGNYDCWQKYMTKCSKATFVSEESEASYGYTIKGMEDGKCAVIVKLLMIKKGELKMDKLINQEMTCYYPKGIATYAQGDLGKCHGLLKESLLEVNINNYHSKILENLGKFKDSLNNCAYVLESLSNLTKILNST